MQGSLVMSHSNRGEHMRTSLERIEEKKENRKKVKKMFS